MAAIDESHIPGLLDALSPDFYVDESALRRAIRGKRSTNLLHQETLVKVDLFVAGATPLDDQQIARRQAVTLDGRTIYVHSAEDILLQKLLWFRNGSVSDRQWRDILAIVRVQGDRLDAAYLRLHADAVGVADLLDRAPSEGAAPA